jgi:hypothetical protein
MLLRSAVLRWSTRASTTSPLQRVSRALLRTGAPARPTLAPRVTGVTVTASAQQAPTKAASEPKTFKQLGVMDELQAALADEGISKPTEIQVRAAPDRHAFPARPPRPRAAPCCCGRAPCARYDPLPSHTHARTQALSLPALAKGGSFLLASHTGSGKTLSYLLPVVQRLKLQERQQQVSSPAPPPPYPPPAAPAHARAHARPPPTRCRRPL